MLEVEAALVDVADQEGGAAGITQVPDLAQQMPSISRDGGFSASATWRMADFVTAAAPITTVAAVSIRVWA